MKTVPIRIDLPQAVHAALKSKASLKKQTLKGFLIEALSKVSRAR